MEKQICCVCHLPVEGKQYEVGGRVFCEKHFKKIDKNRNSLWIASFVGILFSLLFVGVVFLIEQTVFSGTTILVGGFTKFVIALLPPLVWMLVFYRLDYIEPEPKGFVIGIIVLGIILASGVSIPLLEKVIKIDSWFHRSGPLLIFVESILLIQAVRQPL